MPLFKRASQRYGQSEAPETPYQKARQLWDERIGSARVQAMNWRLMAFSMMALSTGLAIGLMHQASQSSITPYVVEVDQEGTVRAVGPATEAYRPSDAQIAHHLARFIRNVRALSLDPVVVRQSWLEAYDFTTDRAAKILNEHAKANDPFAAVGDRSISVEVTSVVRASEGSFQVKWIEQTFERGSLSDTSRYTALLSIVLQPPATEDQLQKNPLGIYVNGLDWSRELA
jgi:type IV secretion system protein VirB5